MNFSLPGRSQQETNKRSPAVADIADRTALEFLSLL